MVQNLNSNYGSGFNPTTSFGFMISELSVTYQGAFWYFNKWMGLTYSMKQKKKYSEGQLPDEIVNPFLVSTRKENPVNVNVSSWLYEYAFVLVWAAKHCYPIVFILSHLRLNVFENAQQASWVFQQITQDYQQKLLCLPRSVFVATTSKRFKEHGTLYIGVFLPSRNMHAWIIEDNMQTDGWDNYWILYQPLIMMRG